MFHGRTLLIATNHGKEKALAPLLEKELGVKCILPPSDFNSDQFGTFTGEVERKNDPLTTLRQKCTAAQNLCKIDLGVATEGSFGAHPSMPFTPANDELIILIDLKNNLEIVARELSLQTNYNKLPVTSSKDLREFAIRAGFPNHRLILSYENNKKREFIKNIDNPVKLFRSYLRIAEKHSSIMVETDMRAMSNPTRMEVIGNAARNLIKKIKSCCPECGRPGFDTSKFITGLPCRLCGKPTRSVLSIELACKGCNHTEIQEYPDSRSYEDPMYCDHCNP